MTARNNSQNPFTTTTSAASASDVYGSGGPSRCYTVGRDPLLMGIEIPRTVPVRSGTGFDGVYDGTINLDTGEVRLSQGDKGYVGFEGMENKPPSMKDIPSFFLSPEELDSCRIQYVQEEEEWFAEWKETGETPQQDLSSLWKIVGRALARNQKETFVVYVHEGYSDAQDVGHYSRKEGDKVMEDVYYVFSSKGDETRVLCTFDGEEVLRMQSDGDIPVAKKGSKAFRKLEELEKMALPSGYDVDMLQLLKRAGAEEIGNFVILYGKIVCVHDGVYPYYAWDSGFEEVVKDRLEGRDPRAWAKEDEKDDLVVQNLRKEECLVIEKDHQVIGFFVGKEEIKNAPDDYVNCQVYHVETALPGVWLNRRKEWLELNWESNQTPERKEENLHRMQKLESIMNRLEGKKKTFRERIYERLGVCYDNIPVGKPADLLSGHILLRDDYEYIVGVDECPERDEDGTEYYSEFRRVVL